MKKANKVKEKTIFGRMMALLLAVLIVQMGIYLVVFQWGGVVRETEKNALYIFSERAANRKLYLENEMLQRWSSTREGESDVIQVVQDALQTSGASISDLKTDSVLCQQIISTAAPDIVAMLRRNGVTGAFLVLDSLVDGDTYPGFYVRDYDPGSFSENNEDLLMERGLPVVAREVSVAMDSYWSAFFRFPDPTDPNSKFFFAPLEAAKSADAAHRSASYYYYWSGKFSLDEMDREVITYSIPLVWEDGSVFGVLGVDITTDYLAAQLKYEELGEARSGAYFLGITTDNGATYTRVCTSGPNYRAYFGQSAVLKSGPAGVAGVVELTGSVSYDRRTIYGAVQPIQLYNKNTPFEGEQWALIGIMDSNRLLYFSKHIHTLLLISSIASLALGMALIFLAGRTLTKPITSLVTDLQRSDPDKPIRLSRIHTTEIDALTEAIENLSNAAVESAARISKIIAMTHIPIGVFEWRKGVKRVFCSHSLFVILKWPEEADGDCYLSSEVFGAQISKVTEHRIEGEDHIFRLPQENGGDRWVQLFYSEGEQVVLGAFQDVTRDMDAKRKMEYERNFDILTDLFNRRAFDERISRLFEPEKRSSLNISALLMFDLDNLKYVNDTYGHDYGDQYIQAFAKSLAFFCRHHSIVGRRSGDEFNVFLYGYANQNEVRRLVAEFWTVAVETAIALPDSNSIRVRASGGLAWYPENAEDFDELLKMADFAMYDVKHTTKGMVKEFKPLNYAEKAILIHGQDALNRLIENRLVRYAFQPIVSAADGTIWGYELLMRPLVQQLSNLGDLFRLARAEAKLYQLERLTWFEAMAAFSREAQAGRLDHGELAFINSIGGQCLSDEDMAQLEARYGALMGRVVIELTEGEEMSTVAAYKRKKAADWHALLALDDYGSGFNGESVLMEVKPNIVKVDISITRDIDHDFGRQILLRNLISYAKERNIMVLAEGVETEKELETVLRCGVDYLQGYYFGKPKFDLEPIPRQAVEKILRIHREN